MSLSGKSLKETLTEARGYNQLPLFVFVRVIGGGRDVGCSGLELWRGKYDPSFKIGSFHSWTTNNFPGFPGQNLPRTAVAAGDPFRRTVNHPTLQALQGFQPMIPPEFWEASYPDVPKVKSKVQETPKPKFTAQQIRVAHQILQHGNSLAAQASRIEKLSQAPTPQ